MQQLRDKQGRFVSKRYYADRIEPDITYYNDEEPITIAPLVKASLALTNNWSAVVGYVAYALICFGFGLAGGWLGASIALR